MTIDNPGNENKDLNIEINKIPKTAQHGKIVEDSV
jgi:hypothetical protein